MVVSMFSPSLPFLQPPHTTQLQCNYFCGPPRKLIKPFAFPLHYKTGRFPSLLPHAITNSSFGQEEDLQERNAMIEKNLLAVGLHREYMPKHVATVMDGYRRWAKKNNLPATASHESLPQGDLCRLCIKLGIPIFAPFQLSTLNLNRTQMEVDDMMSIFENHAKTHLESFIKEGIKVSYIGHFTRLPISLQTVITEVEEATKNNTNLHLIYGVGYGGQYDIMQACQSIGHKVKDGLIEPEQINESLIQQHLQTNCIELPYPDLLIRSGGKKRLSNYCMWNLTYTELYCTDVLGPDFGETEFIEALHYYQEKQKFNANHKVIVKDMFTQELDL